MNAVDVVQAAWPEETDLVRFVEAPAQGTEAMAPDVDVQFISAGAQATLEARGVEGMAEGWRDWLEPYEYYRLEVDELVPYGDDLVLTLARVRAKTKRDGVELEHDPAAIWNVRDGRVVSVRFFLDREEARAVAEAEAGAAEPDGSA